MRRSMIIGAIALATVTVATLLLVKLSPSPETLSASSSPRRSVAKKEEELDTEVLEDTETISAYAAMYGEDADSMRQTLERLAKSCVGGDETTRTRRGIYVDFIYNPKYYFELTVLRRMLQEILNGNPHMPYYYDTVHYSNSTIVTVGYEHTASRFSERSVITIKPKLLKDILYTANIFDQIYNFLLAYFRSCVVDPTLVPEYDRTINFKRYRSVFSDSLVAIDEHNQATTVCRNDEVYGEPNRGRVCIVPRVNVSEFRDLDTARYWRHLLSRLGTFMGELLEETFVLQTAQRPDLEPCYRIELVPETDIRRVLLFPHAAVKTAMPSERLKFGAEARDRIAADVILYKHRVLHALGVGHRYTRRAVMNSYDNEWQLKNLFAILPEDHAAMARCYGTDVDLSELGVRRSPDITPPSLPSARPPMTTRKYVKDLRESETSERLLELFIADFDKFMFELQSI